MSYDAIYNHQYYLEHKEKMLDYFKTYYITHRRSEATKEHMKILEKWHQENPNKAIWVRHAQNRKEDVLNHYCLGRITRCVRCGIDDIDVLCLDHINGNGAKQRREVGLGSRFYQWIRKNNYPEGYQVLCMNCNLKKKIREGL